MNRKATSPLPFLALTALSAAAISAFIFVPRSNGTGPQKESPSGNAPATMLEPAAEKAEDPRHLLPQSPPRTAPLDDWTSETIPEMDVVRAARLEDVVARVDVAEHGVDALLPGLKCDAIYMMVREGRSGPGGVGCTQVNGNELIRVGPWVHREPGGDLEVGEYRRGQRSGQWERYSSSGMLRERGSFKEGQRDGSWESYSPSGEHLAHRSYHEGAFHGVTVLYHRQQPTVEVWQDGKLVSSKSGFGEEPQQQALAATTTTENESAE